MKKFFLMALLATTMVVGPADAQDNLLMRSDQSIGGLQQYYPGGVVSFGVSYTYRFGASKVEEYGTLNIRNFNGLNIPVVNFSSMGTKPSQFILNAVDDRENLMEKSWLYVVGGVAILAGGFLILNGDRDRVCIEWELIPDGEGSFIQGQCIYYT